VGDSAGSSGNFSNLFDGQQLTPEEQALLKELKQREKDSNNPIVGEDCVISSPVDFTDMDEEDEDDDFDDDHDDSQPPYF
jgi:hypothetical protein